ncbi:protein YLS7-like [Primulina huaijiensis]|uniref:protein YLS7-like n=1 Tax=Primulina huaijiensis TaxID=1492673 RepID=UPI003CC7302E
MTEVARPAYPRSFLSIIGLVGGLSVFLVLASTVLVQQPIGSTVRGYFYFVDRSIDVHSDSTGGSVSNSNYSDGSPEEDTDWSSSSVLTGHGNGGVSLFGYSNPVGKVGDDEGRSVPEKLTPGSLAKNNLSSSIQVESKNSKNMHPYSEVRQEEDGITNPPSSGCDLYHGTWIYDPIGPLYTNNSCPVITQMQNCQGNGRPDKEYENWRWKPSECDLPRFDPKMFLELMRGKTLAFIGDSVARNQMESMLCILWQVEVPKNRGNRKMQRYYFRSTSTMIVRIWSSWLVHQTPEPFDFASDGIVKLHLDLPDEVFMDYISGYDVVVLSSGHWFAKQSVYILNNEIVGGQLWWPDNSRQKKIDNIEAFGISIETILTAIGTHPNYTGLTLVRTFSPDHYEGGEWNTGGSCTGKERPILEGELIENRFTDAMHEKQVTGFYRAMKKKTNKSKSKLMDITEAFSYRHDGHPGPYRSPDPNKITQRGPNGRPPPQDCLHWCMPGPVDTWNELVLENIRRGFQDS